MQEREKNARRSKDRPFEKTWCYGCSLGACFSIHKVLSWSCCGVPAWQHPRACMIQARKHRHCISSALLPVQESGSLHLCLTRLSSSINVVFLFCLILKSEHWQTQGYKWCLANACVCHAQDDCADVDAVEHESTISGTTILVFTLAIWSKVLRRRRWREDWAD